MFMDLKYNRLSLWLILFHILATIDPVSSYAQEVSKSEFFEFNSAYKQKAFERAWSEISRLATRYPDSPEVRMQRGYMLYIGLGTEQDTCKAVRDFEAAAHGGYVYATVPLDEIYNYLWLSIAAEEGSVVANRRLVAKYIERLNEGKTVTVTLKGKIKGEYLEGKIGRAAFLGVPEAIEYAKKHDLEIRDDYQFTSIICPVRNRKIK